MGKVWVLDTDTKGTGASMVPLEKTLKKPEPPAKPGDRRPKAARPKPPRRAPERKSSPRQATSTPLPPGHVRKRATGEIGRVQAVDAKAGTATVRWLKGGAVSTVPLTAISRH
jgi:hypothetical protein